MYISPSRRLRAGIYAACIIAHLFTGTIRSTPAAHAYVTHMYGTLPGLPLINYIGKITQALALTSTNHAQTALLYGTALLTRSIDGAGCFTAAISEAPDRKPSIFHGPDGPLNRITFALHGGFQMSAVPFHMQLLRASKELSSSLKANPSLVASLKKTRNKRIVNATLSLGILLLTRLIMKGLSHAIFSAEPQNSLTHISISTIIYTLLSRLLLDHTAEKHNIEIQLLSFANRFKASSLANKPFFNPPGISVSRNGTSQRSGMTPNFQKLSAHEVRLQDPEGFLFESLSIEDLKRFSSNLDEKEESN